MDRQDTPIEQMEVLTYFNAETQETIIHIVPAFDYRSRITVTQSHQYVVGGWQTIIHWTGGDTRERDAAAFLAACQKAIDLRDILRELHPDDSL